MAEEQPNEQQRPTSSGEGTRIKLECPFDLETVFTLQYSTEGLKGVLTWIIDLLGEQGQKVSDISELLNSKLPQI